MRGKIKLGWSILLYAAALCLTIISLTNSSTMVEYRLITDGFIAGAFCAQASLFLALIAYVLNRNEKAVLVFYILFVIINSFAIYKLFFNIDTFLMEYNLHR
jgi:hypothetical protein